MFMLNCCSSGVHPACLERSYPHWRTFAVCPKCLCRTRVYAQVIKRDKFSPTDSDKIEAAFLKHHTVNSVPMTAEEIHGLRVALNVRGYRAMRHVSHRIFLAAIPFWIPLAKEKVCEWEDIVSRLSLGLTWNQVDTMRDQYWDRVRRDGRGDAFHHLIDYLLGLGMEDDGVATREMTMKGCCDETCQECKAFIDVFEGQRVSEQVGMANRTYLYKRVDKELYNSFVQLMKKEVKK